MIYGMNKLEYALSPLALKSIKPSFINKMTADFAVDFRENTDLNLGIGYVNDRTIPTEEIGKAYQYVMSHPEKYRNALNYGGAEGSPNLTKSIKDFYKRNKIGNLTETEINQHKITIGVNGTTSLLDAFSDVLAPGIVIIGDPFYYSYTENLVKKGFTLLPVKSDTKGIIPEEIEKAIATINPQDISFIYIITVNNPDSLILSNERRHKIVEIADEISNKKGQLLPVIFDKAYEDIIHNPEIPQPDSGLKYNEKGNIFEVGTFSKLLAPALRIGFLISKDNIIRQQIIQRISDIGFSNSLINQEITSRLIDHNLDQHKLKVNAEYRRKAVNIKRILEEELSDYIEEIRGGDAGFYFYITFKDILTSEGSNFFKFMGRKTGNAKIDGTPDVNPRLIYVPGTVCSQQKQAERQMRLSYGFEEPEVFARAAKLMKEACEYCEGVNH